MVKIEEIRKFREFILSSNSIPDEVKPKMLAHCDEMEKRWDEGRWEAEKAICLPSELTKDEIDKLRGRWKEIEKRFNVEVEDISASSSMNSQVVKEITFNDMPGSEPARVYIDWEDVMYGEDGNELSSVEIENNEADVVEDFLNEVEFEHYMSGNPTIS